MIPQQLTQVRQYRATPGHRKHDTASVAVLQNTGSGFELRLMHCVQVRTRRRCCSKTPHAGDLRCACNSRCVRRRLTQRREHVTGTAAQQEDKRHDMKSNARGVAFIEFECPCQFFHAPSVVKSELIFDYYGFPPHTYELTYPAPGAPALAEQIVKTLTAAGIASATDASRGFDHGMFIPLKLIFPQADIPVVQLSLHQSLDPVQHLVAGRALETLRDQDVLIIGSGMSFNNMRAYGNPKYGPVSDAFDEWLTKAVEATPQERFNLLSNWERAPGARDCHPPRAEEHLLPLMTVAGAAGNDVGRKVFSDRVMETTLSAFSFG